MKFGLYVRRLWHKLRMLCSSLLCLNLIPASPIVRPFPPSLFAWKDTFKVQHFGFNFLLLIFSVGGGVLQQCAESGVRGGVSRRFPESADTEPPGEDGRGGGLQSKQPQSDPLPQEHHPGSACRQPSQMYVFIKFIYPAVNSLSLMIEKCCIFWISAVLSGLYHNFQVLRGKICKKCHMLIPE